MSTPTSFRFPFELPGEQATPPTHPTVGMALRYAFSGLKDLNDAISHLTGTVNSNTTAIKQVAAGVAASGTSGPSGPSGPSGGSSGTHDEPLTDGQGNFIFDGAGDIIVVTGIPN